MSRKSSGSKSAKNKARRRAFKKKMEKQAKASVRQYMKQRRVPPGPPPQQGVTKEGLGVSDPVTFPHCHGVGDCCKNRPMLLEPSDVYRIVHNERAIEKFDLKTTMDLYGSEEEAGIIMYQLDTQAYLPFCAAVRVPKERLVPEGAPGVKMLLEEGDQLCPFLEFRESGEPECILGDDRPTQCATDPVVRSSRVMGKRRLLAWRYTLVKELCDGCRQASSDKDREETVASWLLKRDVEERYIESDLFHAFIDWMHEKMGELGDQREFIGKMATIMLFDWHRFAIEHLGQPADEVIEHSPDSPRRVMEAARKLTEAMIMGGEKLQEGNGDADTDQGSPSES